MNEVKDLLKMAKNLVSKEVKASSRVKYWASNMTNDDLVLGVTVTLVDEAHGSDVGNLLSKVEKDAYRKLKKMEWADDDYSTAGDLDGGWSAGQRTPERQQGLSMTWRLHGGGGVWARENSANWE